MTTTRDIIERAYRKLGVVAQDEPMTADQGAAGLDALNAMMHGWEAFGIDLNHVDLALGDTFSMAAKWHEGAVYQLASRLAPDMSVGAPDSMVFLRMLQAGYLVVNEVEMPYSLVYAPSRLRWTF